MIYKMKINESIFKAYDIRGIYPTDINEEILDRIIRAIYTFFTEELHRQNLQVALGYDMRVSGPSLFAVAKRALSELGAQVFDIGMVSTPTFYFSVLHHKFDCGIQVSASHNPPQWNGLKFVKRVEKGLIKIGKGTGMDKVKELALNNNVLPKVAGGEVKIVKNVVAEEVKTSLDFLKPKHIKKFKVVADPANAMGITYLEELFKKIPCELIKMNFKLDGTFPAHQPDPLDFKNLIDLQKRVISEKADLGIAPDGDGDRVFFIDEKGRVIQASLISSLIATEILKNTKAGRVVIDIRYIQNIAHAVEEAGGKPVIGQVGHALITQLMHKKDAVFCGESSGHYFYKETGYSENSVLTILYVLETMGRERKTISELVNKYRFWVESGEINFVLAKGMKAVDLLDSFASAYRSGKASWLDGLAIAYPDWRFSLRTSNTEPLLRLNVEAKSNDLMKQKFNELKAKIRKAGATDKL